MIIRTSDTRAVFSLVLACAIISALAFARLAFGAERGTLAVLRSFPVHITDRGESPEKRERRLVEIAEAIDAVTNDATEKAALVTIARFESGLAAYVFDGRCSDGPRKDRECDSGRARGIFQIHPNEKHPEIPASVEEQADIALRLWRGGRASCARVVSDSVAGAFAYYGTGGKCAPSEWSNERAKHLRSIVGRL